MRQWRLANYVQLFIRLDDLSHGMNSTSRPTRAQDVMAGATASVEEVLLDFLTHFLTKIGGEPTREGIIEIHWLVSGNAASVLSNLIGGRHGHLALTITSKDYAAYTSFVFILLHNSGNYPPTMGNSQYLALGTERFRKNQAMSPKYTAVDKTLKIKSSRRWNQYSCPHWWTS